MNTSARDRGLGLLFLAAFPLYGVGSALLVTKSAGLGLTLVLANSLVVLAIGRILHAIVLPYARVVAHLYLAARILEALLLGVSAGLVYQAGIADSGAPYYRIAMITLGIASLPLLGLLMRVGRMPAWLGWFGIVAYSVFVLGIVADGFGAVGFGLFLVIPGALFEVTFAVWLIVRGFAREPQEPTEPSDPQLP